MASRINLPESDPRRHTAKIKDMLSGVTQHVREDVGKIDDPRAQALFETTAEVLQGLMKAYDDFDAKTERAWK